MIAINNPAAHATGRRPVFEPGQLIRHRRYGYRGVVVHRDEFCRADDAWYEKNQTQPDRDQPWYHVLVDGSSICTYAAAESLVADASELPVEHPFLWHFFDGFMDGYYDRNDEPWPG